LTFQHDNLDPATRKMAGEFNYPKNRAYVPVGSYGFVCLLVSEGSDASVARDARVQPEADWRPEEGNEKFNDPKLLRHLLLSNPCHSTPFEKTYLKFWVKAPIFVYREWHRHRVWSYNEESARYKSLPAHYWIPKPEEIGIQSTKNHQSRVIDPDMFDPSKCVKAVKVIEKSYRNSDRDYRKLLSMGVPREVARCVVPVGIYSEMVASVSLWNFFKFLDLRNHPDAQKEIRDYAQAMYVLVKQEGNFKIIMDIYDERQGK